MHDQGFCFKKSVETLYLEMISYPPDKNYKRRTQNISKCIVDFKKSIDYQIFQSHVTHVSDNRIHTF